jgi:uncharacterized protein (TIGR00369 family)
MGGGERFEDHWRKLERMYSVAPVNRFYEPVLTVSEDRAEIVMEVRPDFFHAAGAVHGSVYFKMLDDSAFFAANSMVDDVFLLTVSFHVDLIRPVTAGRLKAVGTVVHRARQMVLADAVLTVEGGRSVARGSGSFLKSRITLTPEIGYE